MESDWSDSNVSRKTRFGSSGLSPNSKQSMFVGRYQIGD